MQQVSIEDAVRSSYLITSEELATKLTEGNVNLKIVNGTWYMPAAGKNAFEEHQAKRISQDAVYFDIDEIRVKSSDFPRMIPTVEFFIENMKKLGITKDSEVVCYDVQGMFSVARTEFMLRYFGHENVRILDGGLTKWIAEGRPTFEGEQVRYGVATENDTGNYDYQVVDSSRVLKDVNHMHDYARQLYKSSDGKIQVLDARGAAWYNGQTPEPYAIIKRSGHIKNSINIPVGDFSNADASFKSTEDLDKMFKGLNVNYDSEIINTCGSGVTACAIDLALRLNGAKDIKLYDGSWSEYGAFDEPNFDE